MAVVGTWLGRIGIWVLNILGFGSIFFGSTGQKEDLTWTYIVIGLLAVALLIAIFWR